MSNSSRNTYTAADRLERKMRRRQRPVQRRSNTRADVIRLAFEEV